MARYKKKECICSMCGAISVQLKLISASTDGKPDLDGRPYGIVRKTARIGVQQCPNCGYVSKNIADHPSKRISKRFLTQEKYLTCDGFNFDRDAVRRYYRQYLICREAGNLREALWAVIRGAWVSDDYNESGNARLFRRIGADLAAQLYAKSGDLGDLALRCDLLRRTGQFETLLAETENLIIPAEMEVEGKRIEYERELAILNSYALAFSMSDSSSLCRRLLSTMRMTAVSSSTSRIKLGILQIPARRQASTRL